MCVVEKLCGQPIKVLPKGNYTPQELNDMRGKGMEQGSVAVGALPNIAKLPEGKIKKDIYLI